MTHPTLPTLWPLPADAVSNPYPHKGCGLGRADSVILAAHLDAGTLKPDRVWYNQTVGRLPDWVDQPGLESRRPWITATYCKRPDLIWEQGGILSLAEIKPYASYVAYGQAIIMGRLTAAKLSPVRRLRVVILTDLADPDLLDCLTPSCPMVIELDHQVVERPKRTT